MITQGVFPIHTSGLRPCRCLADRRAMMRLDANIHEAKATDYQLIYKTAESDDSE